MQDHRRGNAWVWVGIVVVVIIVILAFVWKPSNPGSSGQTGTTSNVADHTPALAPQGQLVAGFPPNLVLDAGSGPTFASSYSVAYSSSINQYTAVWNSTTSLATIFSDYQTYLTAQGWKVSNLMTAYHGSRGLHAENASSSIGLSIIDNGTMRTVNLSYVTK